MVQRRCGRLHCDWLADMFRLDSASYNIGHPAMSPNTHTTHLVPRCDETPFVWNEPRTVASDLATWLKRELTRCSSTLVDPMNFTMFSRDLQNHIDSKQLHCLFM